MAPLAFDFVRSSYSGLKQLDWKRANALLDEMAREGRTVLENSGVPTSEISFQRSAEIRYIGQGHEVSVPLPDGPLSEQQISQITASFEEVYRGLDGRKGPDVPLEVINWRLVASGPHPERDFRLPKNTSQDQGIVKGTRMAYFPEEGGYLETTVYDRYALESGATFDGPAIVEERESTLIVGARAHCRVDSWLNVIVELKDD